jgi:hypothetical protein
MIVSPKSSNDYLHRYDRPQTAPNATQGIEARRQKTEVYVAWNPGLVPSYMKSTDIDVVPRISFSGIRLKVVVPYYILQYRKIQLAYAYDIIHVLWVPYATDNAAQDIILLTDQLGPVLLLPMKHNMKWLEVTLRVTIEP